MFLTIVHILAIASMSCGVRDQGKTDLDLIPVHSMSISASASVTKPNLKLANALPFKNTTHVEAFDQARQTNVSEVTLADAPPLNNATHVEAFDQTNLTDVAELTLANPPFKNATHVEAFYHNAVLERQGRSAFSPDVRSASVLDLSHELPELRHGKLEKIASEVVLTLPSEETCILQTSQQLGAGALSSVYACGDQPASQVAVKFVKNVRAGEDPEEAFYRQHKVISKYVVEAKEMFRLHSDFLDWQTIHADGYIFPDIIQNGTLCIVMEKMDNDLFTLYRQQPNESEMSQESITGNVEITKKMWSMVLVGVMRVHQQGMILRELKLENLLYNSEFDVKITDFGADSFLYGTAPYIAPEVYNGTYGASVDAWALGILLYELYFGRPPSYQQILSDDLYVADDPGLVEAMPDLMKDLIHNLLEKNPSNRLCIQESAECCIRETAECPKDQVRGLISDHPWVKAMVETLMDAEADFIASRMEQRFAEAKGCTQGFMSWLAVVLVWHVCMAYDWM